MLNWNEDVFSKHKADICCCSFVEQEIEIEEGSVPHREGARKMTSHNSKECRKEIEMLMEYNVIEPSKSPWACGVAMAKKTGGNLGITVINVGFGLCVLASAPQKTRSIEKRLRV